MVKSGILAKEKDYYSVTEEYETQIPLFHEASETAPLAVVLVACVKNNKIVLIKRKKKAYKDYWSIPGGRIKTGETIKQAAARILKEKTFLDCKFVSVNAVVHEQYASKSKIKNAFILFFVKVSPSSEIKEKPDVKWFMKSEIKEINIIPSDRWLIEKKLSSKIKVEEEILDEENNKLSLKFI